MVLTSDHPPHDNRVLFIPDISCVYSKLDAAQVNALANFTEWLTSNNKSRSLIVDSLDSNLGLRR